MLKVSALRNPAAAVVRSPVVGAVAAVQPRYCHCRSTDQQREGRPLLQALEHVYRPQVGGFLATAGFSVSFQRRESLAPPAVCSESALSELEYFNEPLRQLLCGRRNHVPVCCAIHRVV